MAGLASLIGANVSKDTRFVYAIAHGVFKDPHDSDTWTGEVKVGGVAIRYSEWLDETKKATEAISSDINRTNINCSSLGFETIERVFPQIFDGLLREKSLHPAN